MSDRLNSPTESWRPARRGRGAMDTDFARIGLAAAALAGVLALGAGGYAMVGHRVRVTPVIEADSRPLRVRPDNPGGAMVAGAEEQVMGATLLGLADTMAPPAEAPLPQALRAQIDAVRQAAIPAPTRIPPASPPLASPPEPASPPVALAVPAEPPPAESPEPRPAPPRAAAHVAALPVPAPAVPAPPAPPPALAGGTQVQLAAVETEQAARSEWQRLSHRMPDLLGSRHPAVLRAERDGKTIWRLRTGGFADAASAGAFCAQVRSKGAGCSIASF